MPPARWLHQLCCSFNAVFRWSGNLRHYLWLPLCCLSVTTLAVLRSTIRYLRRVRNTAANVARARRCLLRTWLPCFTILDLASCCVVAMFAWRTVLGGAVHGRVVESWWIVRVCKSVKYLEYRGWELWELRDRLNQAPAYAAVSPA